MQKVFPIKIDLSTATQARFEHNTEADNVRLISALSEQMGSQSALLSALKSVDEFAPDMVVMLGIAGALSGDAKIGDVCTSNYVLDVLHNAKISEGKRGPKLEVAPDSYPIDAELVASFTFLNVHPDFAEAVDHWRRRSLEDEDSHGLGSNVAQEGPKILIGPVACGPVVASKEFKETLKAIHRKVLAIETESGGVFGSLVPSKIPAVVIRGICDFADHNKGDLEEESAGRARRLAMRNASELLKIQVRNERFLNVALRHRSLRAGPDEAQLFPKDEVGPNAVAELEMEIRQALSERSPEFKAKPDSFYLPIPRLRKINLADPTLETEPSKPTDLIECLKQDRRILVRLQRTYPSAALGWSLAYSLIRQQLGGKTALPYVVGGDAINPPRSGFRELLHASFEKCAASLEFARVLIIEEPLFHLKNRMRFLDDQLNGLDAYVIVVTKAEDAIAATDEFTKKNGFSSYNLAPVSLAETAYFLEKAFDMPAREADAVAIRLDDTFRKFQLDAHPTYFAGIGEETIAALINANKRGELIQLAVDGLLSLIVAADKATPPLSRTTRERFLRHLVLETAKRGTPFDDENLLRLAVEFLQDGLLPTAAPDFLQPFFDIGLLYRVNGQVFVTHPFLKSYLLAQALRDDGEFALQYFDPERVYIDHYSFDLYCELGPSGKVIDNVIEYARRKIAEAGEAYPDDNVFVERGRKLITFSNPRQLRFITASLNETADRMETDDADSASVRSEKQKLIDARSHVRNEVRERHPKRSDSAQAPLEIQIEFAVLDALSRALALAATAVGAGSESLSGARKLELAGLTLTTADKFIDVWTRNRLRIDFEEMREELLSDENVWELMEELASPEEDFERVRSDLGAFLHSVELNTIAEPMGRVLWLISSLAGAKVLAPVLNKTQPGTGLEAIIRGVWQLEIDAQQGKEALKSALSDYKGSPVARLGIANHVLSRAYWHHYKTASATHFITAARRALRPLSLQPSEEKIKRITKGE